MQKNKLDFSKKLINDIRYLLWIITLGGLFLAFYCIRCGYLGSLPWITSMVALPYSAHGVICSFYLNMSKSDHQQGGITYELALRETPSAQYSTISNFDDIAKDTQNYAEPLPEIPINLYGPI